MEQELATSATIDKSVNQLHAALERLAPALVPTLVVLGLTCLFTLVAFGVLLAKNLSWGWGQLDMANTGNMGQFIGGTVGTAFAAISSLLLVATILVQIKEYNLTREELVKSVQAQSEMADAQRKQLLELQQQASSARQQTNMDSIARSFLELREEITHFTGKPFTEAKGCEGVINGVVNLWCQNNGCWPYCLTNLSVCTVVLVRIRSEPQPAGRALIPTSMVPPRVVNSKACSSRPELSTAITCTGTSSNRKDTRSVAGTG